jgi:hypothetical protein
LDLGLGMQRLRIVRQDQLGPWKVALRAWATLNVDLNRKISLQAELEAYRAPFAPAGVATTPNWRYFAISFGPLFRLF